MAENVIQIKSGIMINVVASVKNIIYGILLYVFSKLVNTSMASMLL